MGSKLNPVVLYRNIADWSLEQEAANRYFKCVDCRTNVKKNDLVICRYSALPFLKELENDISNIGAKLINSYKQHRYVADLSNWVHDLEKITPRTWSRLEDLPENTSFILKGETNSKKNWWSSMMFAKDKREAIDVHTRLCADSLIGEQEIYIREYVPLVQYMTGLHGQPITKEFRFFAYKKAILSGGFYWSNYVDELEEKPKVEEVPVDFIHKILDIINDKINFVVIDVAQTQSGNWVLIELNDGMMSGISENDPNKLYKNLFIQLNNDQYLH